MSNKPLSPEAAIIWSGLSKELQERLLSNVFCSTCMKTVRMKEGYSMLVEAGNLILQGICATCGARVARLIESAEMNPHRN